MTTIGGLTSVLHRLRAKRSNGPRKAVGKGASQSGGTVCVGEAEMRPLLAARLATIDLSNPDMQEQAVDMFIETALYREFGAAVLEQESFHALLVQVREAMMCTPEGRHFVLEMLRTVRQ